MHWLALAFGVLAAGCLAVAIVGMVTGRPDARIGGLLRVISVVCFATAVVLNVAAH